jgi:hypothetical protein
MYDPYALDRLRIERELRRHLATMPRRPQAAPPRAAATAHAAPSGLRLVLAGLMRRSRPAAGPCTDC